MDTRQHTKIGEELKREKKFSQNIIATIPDSLLVLDKDLRVKSANRSFYRLFQTKPQKVVGSKIGDILGDEDGKFGAKLTKLFGTEDVLENFELHYQSEKLGERIFNITARGMIVAEEEEEEEQQLVVLEDITEQKWAKKALEESEEKYRSLVNNVKLGIFRSTPEPKGKFLEVNPAMEEITGYSRKELLQMNVSDLYVHPEEREVILEEVVSARGKTTRELCFRKKDGTEITVSDTKFAVRDDAGKILYFDGILEDITEHKHMEEALRVSEERYRTLFETNIDGLCVIDETMKVLLANQAVAKMFGFDSVEEMLEVNPFDFIPPEERERVLKTVTKDMFENDLKQVNEFRLVNKAGKEVWISAVGALIEYQGKLAGMASLRDITQHKMMENILKESEEKYRVLVESAGQAISVIQDGVIKFGNPKLVEMTGYPMEELTSMSAAQFVHPDDRERVLDYRSRRLRGESAPNVYHLRIINKKGEVKWLERNVNLITWQGKPAALVLDTDITERKQAEEERKQLEQKAQVTSRLASVGEMAAGVAHEINNPLTGIIGYAQLLMDREDVPFDIRRDLAAINEGAQRVASIVKRLLAFSRQVKPERRDVDINELIESTLALRAYHLRVNNIKVTIQLAPDLPETMADPGQLQQVFLNLVVNAETEMKLARGKGKLLIKTEKVDNTIRISFKDNGPGIAKKNLERIFDPFFTTREVGQGTGLGLSLCHGIVAEHKGKIYAESKLGKGATFIMELPVVTEAKQPKPAEPVVEEPEKAAKARILVVDDEQVSRDFVKRVLAGEGYEVETVDNAGDALKKIEGKRYNLVLIDIKMPGMDGVELYRRIQKIARSLARRVVFITGDIMGAATEKFLSETKAAHIDKPFSAEQLSREVKRALTGGR